MIYKNLKANQRENLINNPYYEQLCTNLPRILALFDADRTSKSYGMGDRYHWAWGLIDFGNGTFQGAANGLARLWTSGLWPYTTSNENFHVRIDAIFEAAKHLTQKDGSLEEAFPREGSYCVTALVAFDLLCAIDLLNEEITLDKKLRWRAIVAPMINYLIRSDETHALISNHLATAVAALIRWHKLTGENVAEQKAVIQLNKILRNQSEEGWFMEYEGADPGYQSLCTCYLADIHQQRPDLDLLEPLSRSLKFLWHFAHPDGSFGGIYGSRCTRFYYPSGITALAQEIPEAAALAEFMESSISQQKIVNLSAIDEPNLIPMFNSYAWAAATKVEVKLAYEEKNQELKLPCKDRSKMRIFYREAGFFLDRGPNHYSIISTHKGGVIYHFRSGHRPLIDAGLVVLSAEGRPGSTQGFNRDNLIRHQDEHLEINSQITVMPKQLPRPLQFIVIRLFGWTLFKSMTIREWIKRIIVNILITRRQAWPVTNLRTIRFGETLSFEDKTSLISGYKVIENINTFVPIHMASQGYWQIQDEEI